MVDNNGGVARILAHAFARSSASMLQPQTLHTRCVPVSRMQLPSSWQAGMCRRGHECSCDHRRAPLRCLPASVALRHANPEWHSPAWQAQPGRPVRSCVSFMNSYANVRTVWQMGTIATPECSYKRVKGRSHTAEKRISMHPYKPHATSQPSRLSHTPRLSTDSAHMSMFDSLGLTCSA